MADCKRQNEVCVDTYHTEIHDNFSSNKRLNIVFVLSTVGNNSQGNITVILIN